MLVMFTACHKCLLTHKFHKGKSILPVCFVDLDFSNAFYCSVFKTYEVYQLILDNLFICTFHKAESTKTAPDLSRIVLLLLCRVMKFRGAVISEQASV